MASDYEDRGLGSVNRVILSEHIFLVVCWAFRVGHGPKVGLNDYSSCEC